MFSFSFSPAVDSEIRDRAITDADPARRRVMEQIIEHNPSARASFLARFKDDALRNYLRHLEATARPRGKFAIWVRSGETPAIVGSERQD